MVRAAAAGAAGATAAATSDSHRFEGRPGPARQVCPRLPLGRSGLLFWRTVGVHFRTLWNDALRAAGGNRAVAYRLLTQRLGQGRPEDGDARLELAQVVDIPGLSPPVTDLLRRFGYRSLPSRPTVWVRSGS